jgi:hypothetical protein
VPETVDKLAPFIAKPKKLHRSLGGAAVGVVVGLFIGGVGTQHKI